jgi:hypothetical protein
MPARLAWSARREPAATTACHPLNERDLCVLRLTAADVEVELNGQVLFAECLPGVGEGFGFQSPV